MLAEHGRACEERHLPENEAAQSYRTPRVPNTPSASPPAPVWPTCSVMELRASSRVHPVIVMTRMIDATPRPVDMATAPRPEPSSRASNPPSTSLNGSSHPQTLAEVPPIVSSAASRSQLQVRPPEAAGRKRRSQLRGDNTRHSFPPRPRRHITTLHTFARRHNNRITIGDHTCLATQRNNNRID